MKRSILKRGTKPLQRKARLKARKTPKAFRKRRDPAFAAWIRTQPCLLKLRRGHQCDGVIQACHVKSRGSGGDDRANLYPCCAGYHYQQHTLGLQSFQSMWGFELAVEAERLYQLYREQHEQV